VSAEELESLTVHLFRPLLLLSFPAIPGFGLGSGCFLLDVVLEGGDPWLQQGGVPTTAECLKSHGETLKIGKGVAVHPIKEPLGIGSCMLLGMMPAQNLSESTADGGEMSFADDEVGISCLTLRRLERVGLSILVWTTPVLEVASRVGA
jgi:hypothetical protein